MFCYSIKAVFFSRLEQLAQASLVRPQAAVLPALELLQVRGLPLVPGPALAMPMAPAQPREPERALASSLAPALVWQLESELVLASSLALRQVLALLRQVLELRQVL